MERLETEVLVIGGGLAALSAALEARQAGRDVVLLCKMKPGHSGNTVLAACNISGFFSPLEDSAESYVRDCLLGGDGIGDRELVETLARSCPEAVPFLERHGVDFLRRRGELLAKVNPGHSRARTITTEAKGLPVQTRGLSLTLPLLRSAEAAGVRLIDSTMAVELLRDSDRVRGALALDRGGRWLGIHADSVVLACGGGGRIYGRSNNTREMTGDGLALAYRAGAELRDLEFIQFHPTMGIEPVRTILPTTLFDDGAMLRNAEGKRFLLSEFPDGEAGATRDKMSRAIFREVAEGRGVSGGVHLDLTGIAPDVAAERYPDLWVLLRRRGCDPSRDYMTVGLAVHFFMGGMTIDRHGASSIPGLFGAGEVTGGIHGANRLGGNALAEAVVFGRIAGKSAARHSASRPAGGPLPHIRPGRLPALGPCEEVEKIVLEVRRLLWEDAGVIRSASSLAAGLRSMEELEERFGRIEEAPSLILYFEARNMLLAARLILSAALRRTESRGAHFRSDYPEKDDLRWQGSLCLRNDRETGADEEFFRR